MAVYDQGFRVYNGPLTAARGRFLVLAEYALRDILVSRRTLVFLISSGLVPLLAAILIYLHHNADAIALIRIPVDELLPINGTFFLRLMQVQSIALFLVFQSAGSTLISADVRDNALPLYLGRPLSRAEYVLGKLTALLVLGSLVTWLPTMVLFVFQSSLEGFGWFFENLRWAVGIFIGDWILLLLFGLVCLAVSAALRAKAAAEVAFAGFFILPMVFGKIIDETLNTDFGIFLHFWELLESTWRGLMGLQASRHIAASPALLTLLVICALAVWVLKRRIQAYEVVG